MFLKTLVKEKKSTSSRCTELVCLNLIQYLQIDDGFVDYKNIRKTLLINNFIYLVKK